MGPGESAPLYIVKRRMKKSPGRTHEHVGWVLLSDGKTTLSRKKVLALMELGIVFKTRAHDGKTATVSAVKCDRCKRKCLRTHPDMSKADDLDNLDQF